MSNKKEVILNILMFIFYFVYQLIPSYLIGILNISFENNFQKSIYFIFVNLIYLLFVIFVYKKKLQYDFKNLKITNVIKYIPVYLIGILFMIISSIIITNITNLQTSQNEIIIRENIKLFPIYMCFSTVIYAPIIEEITFRKILKDLIKDNFFFILMSSFIFGFIHIGISENPINDLLMVIPYIIMGIDFAYIYYRSNNIFTTIIIHSMHNLVLLVIQLIG